MLQRIQSVYLFVVAALMVAMTFLPLATLQRDSECYTFDVFGLTACTPGAAEYVYPVWGLFVLTAIIALLSVVTILLYKKRILQIRLCVFNGILMIGFYVFFSFLLYMLKQNGLSASVRIALSFPLISLILDYLAIRNIGADETLVRSMERLRK
jgi:hypothetical protein